VPVDEKRTIVVPGDDRRVRVEVGDG
jgi:hypothetical protein